MVFRALFFSHHIRESGFKEYGKLLLVETQESWTLESGIQLKESRIQ